MNYTYNYMYTTLHRQPISYVNLPTTYYSDKKSTQYKEIDK